MHDAHMATKTISLKLEAYERLRRARLRPDESFSDVIMRARWPERGLTAGELREAYGREGAHLTAEELDAVEAARSAAPPPEDKWSEG